MSLARTLAIMRKEFRHILRDPQIMFTTMVAPAFVLFLLGYTFAVDMDVIRIGVMDQDHSAESRRYIDTLTADGHVQLVADCQSYDDILDLLQRSEASAVIVIPSGFGAALNSGDPTPLQVVLDSSDYQESGAIYNNLAQRTAAYGVSLSAAQGVDVTSPITVRTHALYNAALKWVYSMIPGLMAAAFTFPAIAAALACTREVENGSYEGLLATPIRTPEYLLGKLVPYILTGTVGTLLSLALALWWFQVPFRGSLGDYVLLAVIFLLSLVSVSMFIGVSVTSQRVAIIIIVMIFFIPTFFLSGLLVPLEPGSIMERLMKLILPAANYIVINRAIFLKGLGVEAVHTEVMNLLRISLATLAAGFALSRRKVA